VSTVIVYYVTAVTWLGKNSKNVQNQ